MSRSGVRPLGERGGAPKAKKPELRPAQPDRPAAAPATPAPVRPPAPTAAPVLAKAGGGEGRAELWAELERQRAELERKDRELRELRAALDLERQARGAAQTELETEQGARAGLELELREVRERLSAREAELQETDQHRRTLQRALAEAQGAPPPPPVRARAIFESRGLMGASEIDVVLRGLGEQREGGALLDLLEVSDPAALEALLEDRVALLCGDPLCAVAPGRAVLRVAPARCDVCGGSDVRRAVRRFQDAALLNGLSRVVIVGGSPQYHRQLRALVNEPRLRLNLVPGDRRRNLQQARADEAGADLVILWGATLLDHSTSELYGRGEGRVLRVPHRGIARMLLQVADALG